MKKLILLAGTALLLAGCNQGGTSDQYGTSSGTSSTSNNPSSSSGSSGAASQSPSSSGANQNQNP